MNYDKLFEDKIVRGLTAEDIPTLSDYLLKKQGWVYIAHSKNNNFLKIGRTGKNPLERASTLSTTGVLHDYDILFALPVFNQFIVEAKIHQRLSRYRVRKEFFSMNEQVAIDAMEKEYEIEKRLLNRFINTDIIKDDLSLLSLSLRKN